MNMYLKINLVFCFLFFLPGCKNEIGSYNIEPEEKKISDLEWEFDFDHNAYIQVYGYLTPRIKELEESYNNTLDLREKMIQHCEKYINEAPTEEMRQQYVEELKRYKNNQEFIYADSWDNWPIVVMYYISNEKQATKILFECRYKNYPVDVIFTMYSPDYITDASGFVKILKIITKELEMLNSEQWGELMLKRKPLYDENDELIHEDLKKFMGDATFIQQR